MHKEPPVPTEQEAGWAWAIPSMLLEQKISCPCQESNPGSSIPHLGTLLLHQTSGTSNSSMWEGAELSYHIYCSVLQTLLNCHTHSYDLHQKQGLVFHLWPQHIVQMTGYQVKWDSWGSDHRSLILIFPSTFPVMRTTYALHRQISHICTTHILVARH